MFSFLCRLRSIAAHRDHFVRRLSVRLSVCVCVCPVVTLSWKTCIAMFRRRHMHSSECCHCVIYVNALQGRNARGQFVNMFYQRTNIILKSQFTSGNQCIIKLTLNWKSITILQCQITGVPLLPSDQYWQAASYRRGPIITTRCFLR